MVVVAVGRRIGRTRRPTAGIWWAREGRPRSQAARAFARFFRAFLMSATIELL
jgi:hypothetical protein